MLKRTSWIAVIALMALVAGCGNQKEAATQAINSAATSLAAFQSDAAALLPDDLAGVVSTLDGLKASLASGDYKAVLAGAPALTQSIAQLQAATAAKKTEFDAAMAAARGQWGAYAADLPNMVAAIQSRVDTLQKSRKLPANISQDTFAAAKSGLDFMKAGWTQATDAYNAGDAIDAVAAAQAVKQKGNEVLAMLGMTPAP